MAKKIYVGNLNYQTTDEELSELFTQFGAVVSARIIMDRYTNRSKGFGFVEMETDEACATAIAELDGKDFKGREVRVSEARERERTPRRDSY